MSDELHVSLEDRLMQMGISKILIDELVSVAVRVNYGQVKHFLINLSKNFFIFIFPRTISTSLIST